jgi:hypothetical protein
LKGTRDKEFIIHPNKTGLEVFVDADISGNWDPKIAPIDKDTAGLRRIFHNAAPDGKCPELDGI